MNLRRLTGKDGFNARRNPRRASLANHPARSSAWQPIALTLLLVVPLVLAGQSAHAQQTLGTISMFSMPWSEGDYSWNGSTATYLGTSNNHSQTATSYTFNNNGSSGSAGGTAYELIGDFNISFEYTDSGIQQGNNFGLIWSNGSSDSIPLYTYELGNSVSGGHSNIQIQSWRGGSAGYTVDTGTITSYSPGYWIDYTRIGDTYSVYLKQSAGGSYNLIYTTTINYQGPTGIFVNNPWGSNSNSTISNLTGSANLMALASVATPTATTSFHIGSTATADIQLTNAQIVSTATSGLKVASVSASRTSGAGTASASSLLGSSSIAGGATQNAVAVSLSGGQVGLNTASVTIGTSSSATGTGLSSDYSLGNSNATLDAIGYDYATAHLAETAGIGTLTAANYVGSASSAPSWTLSLGSLTGASAGQTVTLSLTDLIGPGGSATYTDFLTWAAGTTSGSGPLSISGFTGATDLTAGGAGSTITFTLGAITPGTFSETYQFLFSGQSGVGGATYNFAQPLTLTVTGTEVPEPGPLALVVPMVAALLRRRRSKSGER